MVTPQQEQKYQEILAILNEMQNILAATIALNNQDVLAHPATILVQEAINQIILLDQMTPEEQQASFKQLEEEFQAVKQSKEKDTKRLVTTTKQGKVVLH